MVNYVKIPTDLKMTKADFVIEYLRQTRVAYVKELFDAWTMYKTQTANGKGCGTYGSFRVAIFNMKQQNLIELDHIVDIKTKANTYPRHYYRLTKYTKY